MTPRWRSSVAVVLLLASSASAKPLPLIFDTRPESRIKTPLVVVTSPREGATFAPGDVVKIVLAKAPTGPEPHDVQIFSLADLSLVDVPAIPSTVSVTVPDDAAGDLDLTVIALDDVGAVTAPVTRTIRIVPKARLTALEVEPARAVIPGKGRELVLAVFGTFDDGVTRDLTSATTGTTYRTRNPTIVNALPTGRLRGGFDGKTTVLVKNGTRTAIVDVEVDSTLASQCGNGVLDKGEACDPELDTSGCCTDSCGLAADDTVCTMKSGPRGRCTAGACTPP